MKTSHKEGCCFKETPSPIEFQEPFKKEKKIQTLEISKFKQRLESNVSENLPKIPSEFMNELKEEDLNYFIIISQEKDLKPEFILFSFYFWNISVYNNERLKFSCDHCQAKRSCCKKDSFDPMKQHRWWCPTIYKRLIPNGCQLVLEGLKDEINLPEKETTAYEKVCFFF